MEEYRNMLEKRDLNREEFIPIWEKFKMDINAGNVRVAEKQNGEWKVNTWVKKFIWRNY